MESLGSAPSTNGETVFEKVQYDVAEDAFAYMD